MELKNLSTFLKVCETRNFTKAAQSLGYSQSAVTAQIQQLEKELNVPVFDRMGKSITLTESGKTLYDYARQMLTLEQQALSEIGDQSKISGELRMAIAESLAISFLPEILHFFRLMHPDVDLIVKAVDHRSMVSLLKNNEIDLIYTLDYLLDNPELIRPRELKEPILFIAPSNHPLTMQDNLSIEDIVSEPFILTEYNVSYRSELEKQLAKRDLSIRPLLEVGNTDVICRLVSKGVGLSLVPACIAKSYIEDGSIKELKIPDIDINMYRQLLFYKDKWQTPQMKAMIKLLTEKDFH